jgi:hypothetical protein
MKDKEAIKISEEIADFCVKKPWTAHDIFLGCCIVAARVAKEYDIDQDSVKYALAILVKNVDVKK